MRSHEARRVFTQPTILTPQHHAHTLTPLRPQVASVTASKHPLGWAHSKRRAAMPPPTGEPCPCYSCARHVGRYCGTAMWPHNVDADHVQARILGGTDSPLRWLCRACNRSKGATLGNRLRGTQRAAQKRNGTLPPAKPRPAPKPPAKPVQPLRRWLRNRVFWGRHSDPGAHLKTLPPRPQGGTPIAREAGLFPASPASPRSTLRRLFMGFFSKNPNHLRFRRE